MSQVYIGTSGWVYNWWRGVFYPEHLPQHEWLPYYIAHFPTVEINASFYRLPKHEILRKWRDAAPPGFLYAIKASRFITHIKRLKPDAESLALFLDAARELGPALGPILYQLPPNLKKDIVRLDAFADRLPRDLTHVFEFRNEDWFQPDVRQLLESRAMAFCIHDHHGMDVPRWVTGSFAYWRFHGDASSLDGGYTRRALLSAARQMRTQIAAGYDVYAYFNNDAFGCAVRDARNLTVRMRAKPRHALREMPV